MTCPVCNSTNRKAVGDKNHYSIHQCNECSVLFVHPMPSQTQLNEFYMEYHKTKQYTEKLESKIKRAYKRLRSLGQPGNKYFLDVGCNVGFATEAARRLGYKALGIDMDCKAIEKAQEIFPEANFRCVGIRELAEENHRFDLIYCSEVIEHLTQPNDFLDAIRHVMNDGATFYITTPDVGHFSLPRATHKLIQWNNFRPPEHLIYFTKKSLSHILLKQGFKNIRCKFNIKPTLKALASR